MTAPLAWTDPAAPQMAPPPLVVRPDRGKARSWFALILVMNGSLAVICLLATMWASSTSIGWWGGASFAISLSGCVFQMVFHAYYWGRFQGIDRLLEVGPAGIRVQQPGKEAVDLAWAQVAAVKPGFRRIVIKTTVGKDQWVPVRCTDTTEVTVRQAVTYFSGGRF